MKQVSRTWGCVILVVIVGLGLGAWGNETLARGGGHAGGGGHVGGHSSGGHMGGGRHFSGARVGSGTHYSGTRISGGTRYSGSRVGNRVTVARPGDGSYRVARTPYANGLGFRRPMGGAVRAGVPVAGAGFIGAGNYARVGLANCFGGRRFFVGSGFGCGYFNRQFPCYSLPVFAGYCPVYFCPPMYCLSAPIVVPVSGYDTLPADVSPPPVPVVSPSEEAPAYAVPPELPPPVTVPATQPETPNDPSASNPVIVFPD